MPAAPPPGEPDTGSAVYAGGSIIFGYRPASQLATPRTTVHRPKFPAVDVHCHWSADVPQADLLAAMDELGISHAVNLSGGRGDDVLAMLDRYDSPRLLTLYTLSLDGVGTDGWTEATVADFERAVNAGAAGMKVWKDLGLTARDADGELVAVDDERLDPIWAKAGELGVPVLIHVADPAAFFAPVDERNERWMQLHRHPDWSFFGPTFPPRDTVLHQRDRMIAKHPGTNFIGAHMAGNAEDLAALSARLDALPNLYVDISGRVAELGRQPYTARRFLTKHADRVLFGSDRYPGRPDQPRHKIYYRFLETDDEHFDYHDHPFPPTGDWKIFGVFLEDEALEQIYRTNAVKLFDLPDPAPTKP